MGQPGFYAHLTGGPFRGRREWVIGSTTAFKVYNRPLRCYPVPQENAEAGRIGWYRFSGHRNRDILFFRWEGWSDDPLRAYLHNHLAAFDPHYEGVS